MDRPRGRTYQKDFPGFDGVEPFIDLSRESLKALEEATPRRITFDELDFNFGERWIPTRIYSAYMSNLYATDVKIMYSPSMDEYSVKAQQKNMKIWEEFCVNGYYRSYDVMSLLETRPAQYCAGHQEVYRQG